MKLSKKWTRNWARRTVAGVLAGSLCIGTPGLATMEEKQEYTFDPVLVTAMRRESKDLTTPAAVEVLTNEKIKATGASNALEVLKFTTGVSIETYGARGSLSGGMTGGVSIRGMGKDLGALIMVNGIPFNLNGKYELQNIPADSIERIEIVKGASSTLYGSAALGGVINIITKSPAKSYSSVEVGSFGTVRENLAVREGNISFLYSNEYTGNMGPMQATKSGKKVGSTYTAPYYYQFDWERKQTIDFSWDITKNITWNYRHIDNTYELSKLVGETNGLYPAKWTPGDSLGVMRQQDSNDIASLNIKSGSWAHKLYFNGLVRNQANSKGTSAKLSGDKSLLSQSGTRSDMQTYGIDSQSNWKTKFGSYSAGVSWQKDIYSTQVLYGSSQSTPFKQRDIVSLFGQVDHALSAKTNAIVGLRYDAINQEQSGLKNYYQMTPQFQLLHKLSKEQSLYVNVGQSFRAPNWSAMFLSSSNFIVANPDLEPDQGWTYEVGWKKISGDNSLKFAIYQLDFSNLHKWVNIGTSSSVNYQSQNAQFRNIGLELEYSRSLKGGWGYSLGAMYGKPESKSEGADWVQSESQLQLNAGINYKKDKWNGNLAVTYVGMRPQFSGSSGYTGNIPASIQANLSLSYDFSKNTQIALRVENLFNRIDYTNDSAYITPGRAFFLKLTQKF